MLLSGSVDLPNLVFVLAGYRAGLGSKRGSPKLFCSRRVLASFCLLVAPNSPESGRIMGSYSMRRPVANVTEGGGYRGLLWVIYMYFYDFLIYVCLVSGSLFLSVLCFFVRSVVCVRSTACGFKQLSLASLTLYHSLLPPSSYSHIICTSITPQELLSTL